MSMSDGRPFAGLGIAVVGGDTREQEIARLAAEAGAVVRAYGFPWPPGGIQGVAGSASAAEAMTSADYALFPVPGMALDGSLYAPDAPEPVLPDSALLGLLAPGAAVILGRAGNVLQQAAKAAGVALYEYEGDAELMFLRGPAIVEGALAVAITNSAVTIHGENVGVVGFGNIGGLLARTFALLGATAHVFARNPVQRAAAYATGCQPHPLEELGTCAPRLAMLFSTVPAPVVGRGILERMPAGSLVVDVAAPPGGVDLGAAEALGLRAVWARGLGRSAPVTVGRSQWQGIARRIEEHERSKQGK